MKRGVFDVARYFQTERRIAGRGGKSQVHLGGAPPAFHAAAMTALLVVSNALAGMSIGSTVWVWPSWVVMVVVPVSGLRW